MKVVRSRRALVAAILALALPLALAACGGDDGDGGDSTTEARQTPDAAATTPASGDGEAQLIHVVAKDFEFEGIPDTLPAGSYAIHFENAGTEPHEIQVVEKLTDTPVEDLLKLPQKKAQKQVKQVGGTFAKPGETAAEAVEMDLTPGDYVAVCFVSNKKGPHVLQGMLHEFTVE